MPKLIITLPDSSCVKYGLNRDNITIGRAEDNDIVLTSITCSNYHAVLRLKEDGDFAVVDLGSTNHTRVNQEITQSKVLRHGDTVRFGDVSASYESEPQVKLAPPPPVAFPRPGDDSGRPYLGMGLGESAQGALVKNVATYSPAETAGLLVNDLICGINGETVSSHEVVVQIVNEHRPGDQIHFSVMRGSEALEFTVTLGHR